MSLSISPISKSQLIKIVKVVVYAGISAALGAAISLLTATPDLFGIYTPVINVALVTIKQLFTNPE